MPPCVCVHACAQRGGRLRGGGRGRKQGGVGGGRKRKRRKAAKWLAGDITVICIGAGIKPPRQRAFFILACGAAAAASGRSEHHRTATPVGPTASPPFPPPQYSLPSGPPARPARAPARHPWRGGTAGRAGGNCPGWRGGSYCLGRGVLSGSRAVAGRWRARRKPALLPSQGFIF